MASESRQPAAAATVAATVRRHGRYSSVLLGAGYALNDLAQVLLPAALTYPAEGPDEPGQQPWPSLARRLTVRAAAAVHSLALCAEWLRERSSTPTPSR